MIGPHRNARQEPVIPMLPSPSTDHIAWINKLADSLEAPATAVSNRTVIRCRILRGRPALVYPQRLDTDNPAAVHYLQALTDSAGVDLTRDNPDLQIPGELKRRREGTALMALGLELLLIESQRANGTEIRINTGDTADRQIPDNNALKVSSIPVKSAAADILKLVQHTRAYGRKTSLTGNSFLRHPEGQPLVRYTCRIKLAGSEQLIDYFEAAHFHAISYGPHRQRKIEILAGGGLQSQPALQYPIDGANRDRLELETFTTLSGPAGLLRAVFAIQGDLTKRSKKTTEAKEPA